MRTCTVRLECNIAKRLRHYEGKCRNLHGYRHAIEVTFADPKGGDMVADFYAIRQGLQDWLDEHWDHNIILNEEDKPLGEAISGHTGQAIFYLNEEPTAENLAAYVKETLCPQLFPDLTCSKVRFYDTENAWAEV